MVTCVAALRVSKSPALDVDSEIRAVRAQAAVVRSLLDELEELAPHSGIRRCRTEGLSAQTIEELAQLGRRMLEAASALGRRETDPSKPDDPWFSSMGCTI